MLTRPRPAAEARAYEATSSGPAAALVAYLDRVGADPERRLRAFVAAHPLQTLAAVRHMRALPVLPAELQDTPEGVVLRKALNTRVAVVTTVGQSCAAVLPVPAVGSAYAEGRPRQTLRRKVRSARRAGVSWRPVDDLQERQALIEQLTTSAASKQDRRYRQVDTDFRILLSRDLWLAAYGSDGTPLVLCVAPVDGAWALLECFITLDDSPQHSDARYLLTQALVEELAGRGVRYLVDTRSPLYLTNGLRHFQRMLGFQLYRIRVSSSAQPVLQREHGRRPTPAGVSPGTGDVDPVRRAYGEQQRRVSG